MKTLLLIVSFTITSFNLFSQERYGFGLVVIYNDSADGMITKEIIFSHVLNLDSVCNKNSVIRGIKHKRDLYFECVGNLVIEKLNKTKPTMVQTTSEINNMSQVERFSRMKNGKRINGNLSSRNSDIKDYRKVVFMDRQMAEKSRRAMLEIANKDEEGKVTVLN